MIGQEFKRLLLLGALLLNLCFTGVLFFYVFLMAYLSPGHATMVYVDVFGEADLELIVVLLVFVFCVWGFLCWLRNDSGLKLRIRRKDRSR